MAEYLALPEKEQDVSVVKHFPADRIFNLVGTNPADYTAASGLSAWAVGNASDGLVRIENATTHGLNSAGHETASPAAYVHRSHSGHYGIVNSEEGYQNLTRFLFGELRADGFFHIDQITLPTEVQREHEAGKAVRASYQFEAAVSVRGRQWQLTRREVRENSAIFRSYDQLFPYDESQGKRVPDRSQSPHLFSVFLDPSQSVKSSGTVSFAFDLKLLVPDYEVDGLLFLNRHYEGGYIMREFILVEAFPDKEALGDWRLKYSFQEKNPGKINDRHKNAETRALDNENGVAFDIPIKQTTNPGVTGKLHIEIRPWQ